jgi:hypothetical protein
VSECVDDKERSCVCCFRLYDIILRVNDVDYLNIKHDTAVQTLKMSGKKVRLVCTSVNISI